MRPGRYFQFNIESAARGLAPLGARIALIGAMSSAGTAPVLSPRQIFSDADADAFFGRGSELALMCRWALMATRRYGKAPQIWAVAVAAPAGDARVVALQVAGAADEGGNIEVRIAGRRIRAGVSRGEVAADAALALTDAIGARAADLPVTAATVGSSAVCTHVTAGVNGNDVRYEAIGAPVGMTVSVVPGAAGTGEASLTAALDVLVDKDYDVVVSANHATQDIDAFADHLAEMWATQNKRWRFSLIAETGTLAIATVLATQADDFKQMVVSCEGFRNTPAEIAAYVGAIIAAEDDPALPFNGVELPDLYLADADDLPSGLEMDAGIAGGLFFLGANARGTRAAIVRATTTKTTHNGVTFLALLDATIPRSLVYLARQIDIAQALAFPRAKRNKRTRKALRAVTLDTMRKVEDLEIVQSVDEHADQLVVETDAVDSTMLVQAIPASVVPPLNKIMNVFNLLLE